MKTLSWHSVLVFLQTRPLPLQEAPNPSPVFWSQLHLLKLKYLYLTADGLARASEWTQKTSENSVVWVIKQEKKDNCTVPCNILKSTFFILLSLEVMISSD